MVTCTALLASAVNEPLKLGSIALGELQKDEALVEIHASGVCHTDISCHEGVLPSQFPAVYGHEGGGVILDVGSDMQGFAKGDKVLLSFASCGDCVSCKSQHPAYCYAFNARNFGQCRADGTSALTLNNEHKSKVFGHFFGQSSFASKTIVHRSCLVKVPADTPLELYCPLGCGLQTGAGAVLNTLDVKPEHSLAVFGAGSVGLAAIMAGKLRGAKDIIAIDLQPARLERAKELGATQIINGADEDIVQQIRNLCPPLGVDRAVDCTGVPRVIETMVDSLTVKGRAASVGAPGPGSRAKLEVLVHIVFGREYVGCCEGDSYAPEMVPYLIEQHKQGKFPIEKLITYYDVEDHEAAFADTKAGKTIKAVLKFK